MKQVIATAVENLKKSDLLEPETIKSLKYLIKINKLGFITFDSQEGLYNKKYDIDERAYVIGFMPKKQAIEFNKNFNIKSDKICLIIQTYDGIDAKAIESQYDVPVTRQGSQVHTHHSLIYPKDLVKQERKQFGISSKMNMLIVLCIDPKWHRKAASENGLYNDIINSL